MATKYEVELDTVLEAYRKGLEDGQQIGEQLAQRRIVRRLERYRRERGNPHDVGGPVLDEAIRRCSATVEAIMPAGVDRAE